MSATPGPWGWRENGGHFNISNLLGVVAVAFGEETRNGAQTGVIGDEGEANARLIAAAPDLLAALEALLERVDVLTERTTPKITDLRTVARAAISKARGGGR